MSSPVSAMLAATNRKPVRTNVQPAFVTVRVAPETPWAQCRLLLVRNRMGTSKKSNSCGSSPNRAKVRSAHSIPGWSQSHPVAELPPSYSGFGAGCRLFFLHLPTEDCHAPGCKHEITRPSSLGKVTAIRVIVVLRAKREDAFTEAGRYIGSTDCRSQTPFAGSRRPQERDRQTTGSRSRHIYWHCALLWRHGEGEFSVRPQYLHQGQADENGPTFAQYR